MKPLDGQIMKYPARLAIDQAGCISLRSGERVRQGSQAPGELGKNHGDLGSHYIRIICLGFRVYGLGFIVFHISVDDQI